MALARAVALVALLVTVPGLFLLVAGPRLGPLAFRVAAVPWVSLLAVQFWAALVVGRLPWQHPWVLAGAPLSLGIVAAAAVARWCDVRVHLPPAIRRSRSLLLASALSVIVWLGLLLSGHNRPSDSVPPADDGVRHGWFVTRILDTQSLDPRLVIDYSPDGSGTDASYPLGLHTFAAVVARAAHVDAATALNAVLVVAATVMLPLGAASFFRICYRSTRGQAAAAGVASLLLPTAYLQGYGFGGLPNVVATTGLLALVTTAPLLGSAAWPAFIVSGLVYASVFSVHPSVAFAGAVVACLVTVAHISRKSPIRLISHLVIIGAVAGLISAQQLLRLVTARGTGTYIEPAVGLSAAQSTIGAILLTLNPYTSDPAWRVATDALLGAGIILLVFIAFRTPHSALVHRVDIALLTTVGLFAVMTFGALNRTPGLMALTGPWYGNAARLGVTGAIALSLVGIRGVFVLQARLSTNQHPERKPAIALALATLAVAAPIVSASRVHYTLASRSVFSATDQRTAEWIARHTRPGGRVIGDPGGPVAWYYAKARVNTMFPGTFVETPAFADARSVMRDLASGNLTADSAKVANSLNFQYIVTGTRHTIRTQYQLSAQKLSLIPTLTLVHTDADVQVFSLQAE